jgi:predicted nucleic acid-binding protein
MGSVSLDDIPNGSLCVVDTNVLLYAEQGLSAQSRRLLRRVSTGELLALLPQPVWLELAHKLMLAEAMMLGRLSGPNPARKLASQPDVVKGLRLYQDKVRALVNLGIGFEQCTREDLLDSAFALQEKYGLLVTDSLVLGVAIRTKADVLATADRAFEKVTEIPIAMPTDLHP